MLLHSSPKYDHLRNFGCLSFMLTLKHGRSKFEPRAQSCILLGYHAAKNAYKVYNVITKKVHYNRDLVFHESYFPFHHLQFSTTILLNVIFCLLLILIINLLTLFLQFLLLLLFSLLLHLMMFPQIMPLPLILHFNSTALQFKPLPEGLPEPPSLTHICRIICVLIVLNLYL